MRKRKRELTREEAIQEFLVCKIRIDEFMHILQLEYDIAHGKYQPENLRGHHAGDFFGTLAIVSVGFFASLIDPNPDAINIFDVWLKLFPEQKDQILETWRKIEPTVELIQGYRSEFIFHGNKSIRRHIEALR
jgi:hypothetical protein